MADAGTSGGAGPAPSAPEADSGQGGAGPTPSAPSVAASRRRTLLGALAALLVALACRRLLTPSQGVAAEPTPPPKRAPLDHLFTREELAAHGPRGSGKRYLSILGTVFDVSAGEMHYGESSSYSFFVGRDASKAFQSGEAADATDDLSGFTEDAHFVAVVNWKKFYVEHEVYTQEGRLAGGAFYDEAGNPTAALELAIEAAARYQRAQAAAEAKKMRLAHAPQNERADVGVL
jgi:predicted heme/steroid binding protein